jgi:predicted DNA-binding helix-hairpin-helix protein
MDALNRLADLSSYMQLEPAEDADRPRPAAAVARPTAAACPDPHYVGHALLPNGKPISLLKTLLTSACERNCYYCPFRAGRDFRRATLKPDEMADAFLSLRRGGIVEGIFLSSGIAGGSIRTQDQLIDTAEILRLKRGFTGYLHLKLMPGAEQAQVERAMQLADRVSINLEAPNPKRLELLAPRKFFMDELLQPLRWVDQIRRTQPRQHGWRGRWPSMTTQFVVGAVGESDLELLSTTSYLHQQLKLARAYFSAFNPIPNPPLENHPPTAPIREHRLYQGSFLIRDYGFDLEELPFDSTGNLPGEADPKLIWARGHLSGAPVEINCAGRQELLRVPGIGLKGADAILAARRTGKLRHIEDLHRIGINPARAQPFILLDGKRPLYQLSLGL